LRHGIAGVECQIGERLLEASGISCYYLGSCPYIQGDVDVFWKSALEDGNDAADKADQVKRTAVELGATAEIKDLLYEVGGFVGLTGDDGEVAI